MAKQDTIVVEQGGQRLTYEKTVCMDQWDETPERDRLNLGGFFYVRQRVVPRVPRVCVAEAVLHREGWLVPLPTDWGGSVAKVEITEVIPDNPEVAS